MEADIQDVPYKHKHTEAEIAKIIEETNSEIIARKLKIINERSRKEGVKFGDKQIEEAVTFIKFFENGYFDLRKFFNNDSYRIIPDDQKEFIRRVNQGLGSLGGRVPERKVYIIRNSDNKEVQIEEVGNLTEGAFSIKSKKLIIKHR